MAQDLTTYTERDTTGVLTVTADKVAFTALKRNESGDTFLSKDLGVGSIIEETTLTYLNKITAWNDTPIATHNLWSNVDEGYWAHRANGDKAVLTDSLRNTNRLGYFNGSGFIQDVTAGLTLNVERLYDLSRSGNIYTVIIYNGATVGSGVLDVLSVNAGEAPPDWQFHLACSNQFDAGVTSAITGHTRTFEFTGLAGGSAAYYQQLIRANRRGRN